MTGWPDRQPSIRLILSSCRPIGAAIRPAMAAEGVRSEPEGVEKMSPARPNQGV
jgi:hypothetical protein